MPFPRSTAQATARLHSLSPPAGSRAAREALARVIAALGSAGAATSPHFRRHMRLGRRVGVFSADLIRSRLLVYAALVPTAAAAGVLLYHLLGAPTTLHVAVGSAGGENLRLLTAIKETFARERAGTRLKIVQVATAMDAARALDEGKVDLAVSRSDVAIPSKGDTVVILHADPVTILATARSAATKIADFSGKTIGIAGGLASNQLILKQLLNYYAVPLESVTIVSADPSQIPALVRDGRIDVVFLVQPTASKVLRDAFTAISAEGGGPAKLIPVPEAKAIAQRNSAAIDDDEIVQGALAGNPPLPEEAVPTISVSHRLFARRDLNDSAVAELARLIFVHKAIITGETPLAAQITAPETDNGGTLGVHAGAVAYYDGEVKTFMDRYGDWIYIAAMVLGVGGSTVAAMFSRRGARHRRAALAMLHELLVLLDEARNAGDPRSLDRLEGRADAIFAATLTGATESRLEAADVATFSFAFDHLRKAIEDRRIALRQTSPAFALDRAS